MTTDDRLRWETRYRARPTPTPAEVGPPGVFARFASLFPSAGHALDIACGQGTASVWLARRGLTAHGVDIAPAAIAQARMLAERCDYPLHLGVTEAGPAFQGTVKSAVAFGALLALHSGLAYQTDGIYRRMLRGWFLHHPEQKTVRYRIVTGAGHVRLTADADFAFKDEHYFVHCEEAQTHVFLRSESEDGESIAGWTHAYGAGRVLCLTPAHTLEGLTDRAFVQLLADCLQTLHSR